MLGTSAFCDETGDVVSAACVLPTRTLTSGGDDKFPLWSKTGVVVLRSTPCRLVSATDDTQQSSMSSYEIFNFREFCGVCQVIIVSNCRVFLLLIHRTPNRVADCVNA